MLINKHDLISNSCQFLTKTQVGNKRLWEVLVKQIANKKDKAWEYRGEYWGKVMRGAVLIYTFTQDDELYQTLEATVRDVLSLHSPAGISAYATGHEFNGWDIWCRKYVAVGLEYFYRICRPAELKRDILNVLTEHLLAIAERVGPGKKPICEASLNWGGLNSCSILKAYVVAYRLTGDKRLLDFADYIVSTGGSKDFDFLAAAKDNILPLCAYRYPKAYEATSFFEGLIEYGQLTENKDILRACENYAKAILREEFTVVGGGACNTECYNYSSLTQTYPRSRAMQETCVTVSYMLYFNEMYALTGKSLYLDAMERSFYNAYLGALNESNPRKTGGLPIDWYSPLVNGHRATWLVAGKQVLSDKSYYSCCTAIGAAGAGVFATRANEVSSEGIRFNFYENRTIRIGQLAVVEKTDYPHSGKVCISFVGDKRNLALSFRIPSWCHSFTFSVNGRERKVQAKKGYVSISESLGEGNEIVLDMEMPYTHTYLASARFKGGFLTFSKGPIVYAADKRYTSDILTPFLLNKEHEPQYDFAYTPETPDENCFDKVSVHCKKRTVTLIDYASAGGTYDAKSTLNVFIPYRTGSPINVLACFFDRIKKV